MALNECEHLRMGAAISFAIIILAMGIPLWWKTTEVYRVPLPNDRIAALTDFDYRISMRVAVHTRPGPTAGRIVDALRSALGDAKVFNVDLTPVRLDLKGGESVLDIEKRAGVHPAVPGQILLIEMPDRHFGSDIVVGNHRTIYFHSESSVARLGQILKTWILQDDDLKETVSSVLMHRSSQMQKRNKRQEQRVRASPQYDIMFSVISPQPERVAFDYDQESAVTRFFQPLASQLSLIAEHRLKSQWLYFVELGQKPKRDGADRFVLAHDQLPHIISPLEKKLGSGVSKHPCLHFIIYTSPCEEAPLYLRTRNGTLLNAVLSPRWGGVQLLNPDGGHCDGTKALAPDVSAFMSTFLVQLRTLLGVPDPQQGGRDAGGAAILPLASVELRGWELDALYRLRALEQVSLAQMTLQSLAQLLDEISNIVINEEVGAAVAAAVDRVSAGQAALHDGDLEAALGHARKAFESAENAFTHPSLLALLYFPDDQKYAVYIPLFIPIMIPVILSMRSITFWKKRAAKTN